MLAAQGLACIWYDLVEKHDLPVAEKLSNALRCHRYAIAASYLLQRRTAARAGTCLDGAGVPHALFKGAAVRERLYPDPSVRPADDIDILVAAKHRDTAIGALSAHGMAFSSSHGTVSHEATLRDGRVAVDLHWHLFRPGRSRLDLAPRLLETARPLGSFSVLSDDANLLVQLVHPAFTKYVNGRTARLIRVVDLDRMLRAIEPDWGWILRLIDAAGLRTAAWAVLYWTRALLDTPVDPAVLRHLEPGRLQGRYLAFWIDRQLPARLGGVPGLVQGAFTLALHDRAGDAARALVQLGRARLESGKTLRHLQRIGAPAD